MSRIQNLVISVIFCLPGLCGVVPIGIATSAGDIEIGHVRMPGPATLYEGALVETGSSPAQVSLRNGVVVHLSSEATATIHVDSVSLERGASQVDAPRDYLIRARAVNIYFHFPAFESASAGIGRRHAADGGHPGIVRRTPTGSCVGRQSDGRNVPDICARSGKGRDYANCAGQGLPGQVRKGISVAGRGLQNRVYADGRVDPWQVRRSRDGDGQG